LFDLGDEEALTVGVSGSPWPDLLVVVKGCAGILERIIGPAVAGEQERDVVAALPGSVGIPACFLVLHGALKVAQRLTMIPGPPKDGAKLILDDRPPFVVVGWGEVQ